MTTPSVASSCALRRPGALLVGALALGACLSSAWALDSNTNHASKPPAAAAKTSSQPTTQAIQNGWKKLSNAEQQALKPLAWSWDSMSPGQQRKWLEISKNYPALSLAEQTRMHARMSEWASLTTQERAQARLNFGKTTELSKELSAAEKRAKWEAYQALPAQEKQKLTEKAERKHLGGAPATQPVSPQKLAGVAPVPKASSKPSKQEGLAPLPAVGPATGLAAKSPAEPSTTP